MKTEIVFVVVVFLWFLRLNDIFPFVGRPSSPGTVAPSPFCCWLKGRLHQNSPSLSHFSRRSKLCYTHQTPPRVSKTKNTRPLYTRQRCCRPLLLLFPSTRFLRIAMMDVSWAAAAAPRANRECIASKSVGWPRLDPLLSAAPSSWILNTKVCAQCGPQKEKRPSPVERWQKPTKVAINDDGNP